MLDEQGRPIGLAKYASAEGRPLGAGSKPM